MGDEDEELLNFEPSEGLSKGIKSLSDALESRHPDMNEAERDVMGNALLNQVSHAIESDEKFGSLVRKPDGRVELRIWDILGKK